MRLSLATPLAVAALAALAPPASADSYVDTTPGLTAFAVPAGVTSLTVSVTGGAGGDITNNSAGVVVAGGRAALVTGTVAVTPGQQLQLTVATNGGNANQSTGGNGAAGAPEGGAGGYMAGGGGGATRALSCQGIVCSVAVIAAGGGGAGANGFVQSTQLPGGAGGAAGTRGTDGSTYNLTAGNGGQPGTAGAAGTGGAGASAGGNGSGPAGGAGGNQSSSNLQRGGGGGGGGVFGAGGGGSGAYGQNPSFQQEYAAGGGGGGGSSLAPQGGAVALAAPRATPQIVLTWTPPGAGGTGPGPGTGGGGGGGVVATIAGETLSPSTFRAAPSGPSALAAKVRYGTRVGYTLNAAANVRFTVLGARPGRRAKSGRCAKPTKANRGGRRCKRRATLPGSFTQAGGAGANGFRFTGRIGGRKLKPGRYRLVATPTGGRPASAAFKVVKGAPGTR